MDGRGWQAVEKLNPMPTGQLKCSEEIDITIPSGWVRSNALLSIPPSRQESTFTDQGHTPIPRGKQTTLHKLCFTHVKSTRERRCRSF